MLVHAAHDALVTTRTGIQGKPLCDGGRGEPGVSKMVLASCILKVTGGTIRL